MRPILTLLWQSLVVPSVDVKQSSVLKIDQRATPELWRRNVQDVDRYMEWNSNANLTDIAQRWLDTAPTNTHGMREAEEIRGEIIGMMETFMNLCQDSFSDNSGLSFSGRLLATRGSASTKCPLWHTDHVPVRWIQALDGPGVEVASQVDWEGFQLEREDEDEDVAEGVDVDRSVFVKQHWQSEPGQAVVLVGNRWTEWTGESLQPAVHKSPKIWPWQSRVLLTMNVERDDR
jgi:hypothetical protein